MSAALVCPAGVFELIDASGHPAGHIEVMLKWRSTYLLPSCSISSTEELPDGRNEGAEEANEELHCWQDEEKDETQEEEWDIGDPVNASTSQDDKALHQVIRHRFSSLTFRF